MNERLYNEIRKVANGKSKTSYKDVASSCDIPFKTSNDRKTFFKELNEICIFENSNKRPMICSVVVKKSDGMPGDGFFELARKLGVWDGKTEKERFIENETKKVWKYWSSTNNLK